ncbi:hypothetical protein K1719_026529 [Acacia pycnantha]|nr:hypothetical protein K1719_026529 [Acacia pycnantha]
MQDKALQDIERLIIENMRDIDNYSNAFLNLASKSGQAFTQNMSDKYFSKLPPPFNSIIKDEWYKAYPTVTQGIAPRIVFTKEYLKKKCIENEIAKQVKDYNFCKQVYIPGYFPKDKKRIRRATNYRNGIPRKNHIRKFKRHKPPTKKCRCYGEEGHFARECRNKRGNTERFALYHSLDLPQDFDIVSIDQDDPDNDSDICSVIDDDLDNISIDIQEPVEVALLPMQSPNISMRKCMDRTQLILGKNFLDSAGGGYLCLGNEFIILKHVDRIITSPISKNVDFQVLEEEIEILEDSECVQDWLCFNLGRLTDFENQMTPLLNRLQQLQVIGDNPTALWEKNRITCKLEIINPDLTIQDKPIIPSLAEQQAYQKHIDSLLQIGVIRPSQSRHRTMAFIVYSGTTVNPNGSTVRGKSRNLPDLELPQEDSYIIVECDGSLSGWGGVLKWKPHKGDLASTEKRFAMNKGKTPVKAEQGDSSEPTKEIMTFGSTVLVKHPPGYSKAFKPLPHLPTPDESQ